MFQNYQAQIRLSVKLKFLVGLAHKITEAIGTTNMPQVREQLGGLAASAGMVEAMLAGMEAAGEQRGEFYVPNRHMLYAAHVDDAGSLSAPDQPRSATWPAAR